MNSSTRRFVYSSVLFGAITLCAYADPIGVHSSQEAATPSHAVLHTTNGSALGGATAQTSVSGNEGLIVSGPISSTSDGHLAISDVTQTGLSGGASLTFRGTSGNGQLATEIVMLTPATGKVLSFDSTIHMQHGTSMRAAIDPSTTDSGGTAADAGSQVVTDASAAVSDEVNSDTMSVATTSSAATVATTSNGSPFDPVETTGGTPEPSTGLLAGTMFVGWGIFAALRRHRR